MEPLSLNTPPISGGQAPKTTPLHDRILTDLPALAVIETAERRSRSLSNSARMNMAATVVDAAIVFLRDLRG